MREAGGLPTQIADVNACIIIRSCRRTLIGVWNTYDPKRENVLARLWNADAVLRRQVGETKYDVILS